MLHRLDHKRRVFKAAILGCALVATLAVFVIAGFRIVPAYAQTLQCTAIPPSTTDYFSLYGSCDDIKNLSSTNSLCVMTGDTAEYSSFLASPGNATVTPLSCGGGGGGGGGGHGGGGGVGGGGAGGDDDDDGGD